MKHNLQITLILVLLFLASQLFGLFVINQNLSIETTTTNGEIVINVTHYETVFGDRPDVKNLDALILVLVSVLIGTGFILFVIKFGKVNIWKGFFFFAIFFSLSITIGVFFDWYIALSAAFVLAFLKLWKQNVVIHNITEVLIYSGIALLFVPLFEPLWIIILLLIISAYDMFAVWKSKHMVKLAEFQIGSGAFAGLSIPYRIHSFKKKNYRTQRNKYTKDQRPEDKSKSTNAILGGGDIAFPLLFTGVIMESLIKVGLSMPAVFLQSLVITIAVTISLFGLLVYGKKGRYYPAMPFLTGGCLLGYLIVLLI